MIKSPWKGSSQIDCLDCISCRPCEAEEPRDDYLACAASSPLCPLIALFVYVIFLGTPLRFLTAMYLSLRRDFLRNNVTQRGNGNGEGKSGKANNRKGRK
jgi:hypothetical protein